MKPEPIQTPQGIQNFPTLLTLEEAVALLAMRAEAKGCRDVLPGSLPPRGLRRVEAAAYIRVSPSKFDQMVKDGRMPKPKRIDGSVRWDRWALDIAFSALPNDGEASDNPWDVPANEDQAA
jgi:predicted DNA-binding transcriptional regulator AlpA